jgi:hypothetical protein
MNATTVTDEGNKQEEKNRDFCKHVYELCHLSGKGQLVMTQLWDWIMWITPFQVLHLYTVLISLLPEEINLKEERFFDSVSEFQSMVT